MKFKTQTLTLVFMLLLSPLIIAQSKDTGAIVGTITADDGASLAGVTVTVTGTGLMGERSVTTDSEGRYRFPALRPGLYTIRAKLEGFGDKGQENIRVTTTVRLTIDMQISPRVQEEEVTVVAESPTVDVKSTETASVTLSDEILRNIPYSNFAMDIVNLAPGVTGNVAYRASASTGVAYQVDGVDVSDGSPCMRGGPVSNEEVGFCQLMHGLFRISVQVCMGPDSPSLYIDSDLNRVTAQFKTASPNPPLPLGENSIDPGLSL